MLRARHCLIACVGLACEPSKVVGYGEFEADAVEPAVYDTVELTFKLPQVDKNPFTIFASVTFTRDSEHFVVEGFYDGKAKDGAHVWRARFMPNQAGRWRYKWQLEHTRGHGDIDVGERREPDNHGHVRIDATRPSVLLHDDGTVHYWTGGKWFSPRNYGPQEKQGERNDANGDGRSYDSYYTDDQFEAYLDLLKAHSHNGALLQIGYYPLEDDGISWDLDWVRRADRWIESMRERNVYCQINLFDPWSRRKGSWFEHAEDPTEHVLNAWDVEDEDADGQPDEDDRQDNDQALENYVRYVIARFSGYANVYWELANRIDYFGEEAGDEFVRQASDKYLAWFQKYDPYSLPIGASDTHRARQLDGVSIEFPKDATRPFSSDSRRALIVNELVQDCEGANGPEPAREDATIRQPEHRLCYRTAFWRSFVFGTFGTSEASWLDLTTPLDDSVRTVMRDHERLRTLAFGLRTSLDQLVQNSGVAISASGHVGTRAKLGETYVSYFVDCNAESIEMDIEPGEYQVRWVYPGDSDDTRTQVGYAIAGSDPVRLERPHCDPDLVLVLERDHSASGIPR